MESKPKKRLHGIWEWLRLTRPKTPEVKGASLALLSFTLVLLIITIIVAVQTVGDPYIILNYIGRALFVAVTAYILLCLLGFFYKPSKYYLFTLLFATAVLVKVLRFELWFSIFLVVMVSILGASIYPLLKSKFSTLPILRRGFVLGGLIFGVAGCIATGLFYTARGLEMDPLVNAALLSEGKETHINAPSPAEKGSYNVAYTTYGSGKDKHREAFGNAVTITTQSVNGDAFVDNWNGLSGWWRSTYWGFDAKELPLNAHVWYPKGDGPFPLVLIIHGDHSMQDFSEYGYDYLGELLASRGIILVSVDENFLNTSWTDYRGGLKGENNARAWLLLEHLKLCHEWNASENSLFFNKIDTKNIALIGHSRGGEAVSHAALLNTLKSHPDNSSIPLDYGYSIKSVVAIAPVDGQYKPNGNLTTLKDVDFLVMHGSQDGEVTSYEGSRQFERVDFTGSTYHFKSGLYVKGANHRQFNTTWGDSDSGTLFKGLLNLNDLLSAEEQKQIAEVYISAFLETTLKNDKRYLPLFADYRKGKNWLPETIYLNQFADSETRILCSFDEDDDMSSSAIGVNSISTENLKVWKEAEIKLKRKNKGSKGVFLGWNNTDSKDTTDVALPKYSIQIAPNRIEIDSASVFVFSMAASNRLTKGKSEQKRMDSSNADLKEPIDFSIVLTDASGQSVRMPLSDFSYLQPTIPVSIWKTDFLLGKFETETVFQRFQFSALRMLRYNPEFNLSKIESVDFVFDRSTRGNIVIDNIGFTKPLPN